MLIVTPHSKASHELDRRLKSQACEGDRLPQIVTLEAFLRWLWQQALLRGCELPARNIALDFEESALWEKVLREAAEDGELKGITEMARSARVVERACGWYAMPLEKASHFHDHALSQFARWLEDFRRVCSRAQVVTLGQWTAWAAEHVDRLRSSGSEPLRYWGFGPALPVAIRHVLEGLGAQALEDELAGGVSADCVAEYVAFNDERAELVAAFQWARDFLLRVPDSRITVAVPGLSKRRWAVADAATSVLEPWYFLPRTDESDRVYGLPFDFAAPVPIKDAPIVRDVLALLSALSGGLVEDWILVAQSIYLWDCRFKQKHALVNRIRRYRRTALNVQDFERNRVECGIAGSPLVSDGLDCEGSLTAAEWVGRVRVFLKRMGWPKKAVLGAGEFMALGRFNEALGQVAGCRIEHRTIGYGRFLYLLRTACEHISFAANPESTRLEIIDWGNAQQVFSYGIWVVGANELTFPEPPRPLPFLPVQWQIERRVDGASAEGNLADCVSRIEHVKRHCGTVWFSYAKVSEGLELKPAPLLHGLMGSLDVAVEVLPVVRQSQSGFVLVQSEDQAHLSSVSGEVRRGNDIIKNMAECPFKAIAVHRLRLDRPFEVDLGLGVVERSKLIHAALESFWLAHKEQAEITRWGLEQLQEAVRIAVDDALEQSQIHTEWFDARYLEQEVSYVQARTLETIRQDLTRGPFVVEGTEVETPVQVGGLHFLMRADRVDRVGSARVLVDYKRSKKSVREIARPRITEPQLPLLATTLEDVKGLLWIVTESDQKREGVADEDLSIPGLTAPIKLKTPAVCEDFEALKQTWRDWLNGLARQYESGDCRIDPVDGDQTCRGCHLRSVCRVAEGGRLVREVD